ncbi:arsenate reductase ArsC [Brevundimonas diminuta]|uniref:arsenate reductase ArsC n=1 Tax=Brevundimonas diminuta TaxID=293 RepID=UPI001F5830B7|nr:arsenate reductase ArsC [Brevundimonas diminuta]
MPSTDRRFSVLFRRTGNSARSIIAESILRKIGSDRFIAHSAGSAPKGAAHPAALRVLDSHGYPTEGLRSKGWDEFAAPGADPIDIVVTVCDNAAGEVCPVWPGHPVAVHYGLEDPAAVEGDEAEIDRAFGRTLKELLARISLLTQLHVESLDRLALKAQLQAIHQTAGADENG